MLDGLHLVNQANVFIHTAFKLWNLSPNDTVARLVDEVGTMLTRSIIITVNVPLITESPQPKNILLTCLLYIVSEQQ